MHPAAPHHLPFFIPGADGSDALLVGTGIFLIATIFWVGTLYWKLHSLPERMAHKSQKLQFELVAVLGLISLFTHMHIFWVAGLLLALIDIPDFGTPCANRRVGRPHRRRHTRARCRRPEPSRLRRYHHGVPPSREPTTMLELMICSLVTILPEYLYRRYRQGRRFGHEITFFSVWYELRVGITGCLMLTLSLITMIFYYHPSTNSAGVYFRTVPILPEGSGKVAEVMVSYSQAVKKDQVLFTLESSRQKAALETARRKVAEVDASLISAKADIAKAEAQLEEAKSSYQQAKDELEVKPSRSVAIPASSRSVTSRSCRWLSTDGSAGIDAANATRGICVSGASPRCCLREGQRRGRDGTAPGRSRQDLRSLRRRRAGRTVPVRPGDLVAQIMRPAW
jgi:hypothetical protein